MYGHDFDSLNRTQSFQQQDTLQVMVKSTDSKLILTWSDEEMEDKIDMLREAASLFETSSSMDDDTKKELMKLKVEIFEEYVKEDLVDENIKKLASNSQPVIISESG
jgi:hypothetical protein